MSLSPYANAQIVVGFLHILSDGFNLKGTSIMGKYVLGWFLGVPVFVLVIIYVLFN